MTFHPHQPFRGHPGQPGQAGQPGQPGQPGVPAPKQPLLRPRKVRGGVKLPLGQGIGVKPAPTPETPAPEPTQSWAAQRWGRYVEQIAEGACMVEGLEYASIGQTKRLTIQPGLIDGSVQGREFRAYVARLELSVFKEEQWAEVVASLADSAIYSAKLLSGEVPANIEDIFAPLTLKLFPAEVVDVKASCTCGHPTPWCKHVCCIAHLFASRLSSDPFLMFVLRGIETDDLRERLRQKRVVVGAATGSAPVYSQRISGASDISSTPLDQSIASFYDAGEALSTLETPISLPAVSHPLLRRLGPSPFLSAPFPLVGLLASCYETISAETIAGAELVPQVEAEAGDEVVGDEVGDEPIEPDAEVLDSDDSAFA